MDDPLWYKDAILYELHVRSFQDGNQDGIGDFAGLTQRLDYLADLGITAVWLLPFTRSPLKDDGYDIADYTSVHPNYGTLEDFRSFLEKAHAVGIRVITELVINHTSDQHPWFQRARRAPPGSSERNFYVWSDNPDQYAGVPLMFPDFESSNWAWDPVAKQYYWHRFYSHQPDLNFENPDVWNALLPVVDFWFEMGVDGMRLDAVPYLFEREGTACEHLPETHAFLKALRKHVDDRFPNRMFLAEANAWPDDMVAYFGNDDQCQMAFHFPLMPRLFMALQQEDRFPIADILAQTPAIPNNCQWCLFLRNHDELTLAMVTDQERDAMYSAYARDRQARLFLGIRHRLAPLLRNDRRRIELMNAILFSLPGTPVLYYGDEIGMGDNIYLGDRNGVRTPMQWSDDRNAGFSRANSQKLYLPVITDSEYHYEAINVEAQQNNHSSLLWWSKRLIAMRKRHPAFGRGDFRMIEPENAKVLAYIRQTESECLFVVANLSRFVQNVRFDLSSYAGLVPEELFGRTRFPVIQKDNHYGLTLGPHGFYWFALVPEKVVRVRSEELPLLPIRELSELARGQGLETFSGLLASRYSKGQNQPVLSCRLIEQKPVPAKGLDVRLFNCRLEYETDLFENLYQLVALVPEERFQGPMALPHEIAIARTGPPANAVLCDPIALPEYASNLLTAFREKTTLPLAGGASLAYRPWSGFTNNIEESDDEQAASIVLSGQPISTVILNRKWLLHIFRRPDEGLNPDVEIGKFLGDQRFQGFAEIVGTVEYRRSDSEPITLGALHNYVSNQGTAWQLMLDHSSQFFEVLAARSIPSPDQSSSDIPPMNHVAEDSLEHWGVHVGSFIDTIKSVATFTSQLHLALASALHSSPLASIPINQRAFYQSLRNAAGRLQAQLSELDPAMPDEVRELADEVRKQHQTILNRIRTALDPNLVAARRIRCHGNFRLGQLLVSGHDFILSDFEGIKDRPIGERMIKRSPLHDVATLLSSLNYAINSVRLELTDKADAKLRFVRDEDRTRLKPLAIAWLNQMEREFFAVYTSAMESSKLLPPTAKACQNLLELSLLEQAFQNVETDLVERPEWAVIPLSAILNLLDTRTTDTLGIGDVSAT